MLTLLVQKAARCSSERVPGSRGTDSRPQVRAQKWSVGSMQDSDRWPERVNCQSGGGELNVRAHGFGPLLLPLERLVPKKATKRKRLGPCAHRASGERPNSHEKSRGPHFDVCGVAGALHRCRSLGKVFSVRSDL